MIVNNVEGTANLVNAALEKGVKRICHVSSVAALGRLQNGKPTNEEIKWIPSKIVSGYSESKFFSEAEIWRGIEEGLDAVIVNPTIVLGPGNWISGSQRLFKSVWDGTKFYTKGVTGFVDVKDVVKAMILLMDESNFEACKNQRYLLNAENRSYEDLFFQIADSLNKPRPKYFASNFHLNLAWRTSAFYSKMTGKPPKISRDIVKSANKINNFDGSKITRSVDFKYTPVSESIQQTADLLKNDMMQ
jgi:nucleoside-diphosphate-sugar epimerase